MKGNFQSSFLSSMIRTASTFWFVGSRTRKHHNAVMKGGIIMTANQVAYFKATEEQRHNLESERQKDRDISIGELNATSQRIQAEAARSQASSASAQADIARSRQSEEARHNFEQEAINWWSSTAGVAETQRHNKATEAQQMFSARSLAGLQKAQSLAAAEQASAATLSAQAAQDRAYASLLSAKASGTQAAASMEQARVAGIRANTELSALGETIRHNTSVEGTNYITASAARTQAATSAKKQRAEQEIGSRNATSNRITSVANAVRAGSQALGQVSGIARSIVGR